MKSVHIIIVAAGSGSRFGGPLPKQFCPLGGRPVVMQTIQNLRDACPSATMTLVINPAMQRFWENMCNEFGFPTLPTAYGGATRWESVKNALATVPEDREIIMVHDGARPLVTSELMKNLLNAFDSADNPDGAVPAVPVTDSLRRVNPEEPLCSESVNRAELRAVQTPQAFRANLLRQAYELPYCDSFTDDASVMAAAGYGRLALTQGSPVNIKITNPLDLAVAETLLYQMQL